MKDEAIYAWHALKRNQLFDLPTQYLMTVIINYHYVGPYDE